MTSIANVIMNRAAHGGWFGATPRQVCLKPLQFDCWMPNDPNYPIIMNATEAMPVFSSALTMAQQALAGELPDITDGATYYIAESMKVWPHWAQGHEPCASIANQSFFNDIV